MERALGLKAPDNELTLSPVERSIILDHVPMPKGLDARLRFAVHSAEGMAVRLGDAELEVFCECMLEVLSETDDTALADILTGILSRIHPVTQADIPETFDRSMFPPEIPDAICQEIHDLLRSGEFETLEEAYAAVQELLETHNDQPQDHLLGLTPEQGYRLLARGWNESGSVVQIQNDMAPEELSGSEYYRHATIVLGLLEEAGGAKLTAKKNLNRAWVQRIVREIIEPRFAYLLEDGTFDSISEERCPPVHYLRIFLEAARLVRVDKGKLRVTKLGRDCLKPDRAGDLQARLFLAMVTKFNLAYFDGMPDYYGVQETYPFIVYALGQVAREPVTVAVVRENVYLPQVAEAFAEDEFCSHANVALHTRVLRPLLDFGILIWILEENESDSEPAEDKVQVSPLFDRMIHFVLEPEAAPEP